MLLSLCQTTRRHFPEDLNLKVELLGALAKLGKATTNFVVCASLCPHGTTRPPFGRIFMKVDI